MKRRNFLKSAAILAGSGAILPGPLPSPPAAKRKAGGRILNAYYLRAQMYTMVPRQINEDIRWMADAGTNVISLAILEQDIWAADRNIEAIYNAALKEGIEVWGVPSRWGGLVAGAPKVPSLFSASHPDTWMIGSDGRPVYSPNSAVVSSIYHPGTFDFFCKTADQLLSQFPIKGLVWDEPKYLGKKDFSKAALKVAGKDSTYEQRVTHHASFFSSVNTHIRQRHPDLKISLFVYANSDDTITRTMATVRSLDYYGCDGRPWRTKDGGEQELAGKTLVDNGPRFIAAGRKNGAKSLLLMENHNLASRDFRLLEKGIPEVMALQPDQLIYYYYPRNVEDPEKAMDIVREQIKSSAASSTSPSSLSR
jgi:hypothetical protein